MNLLPGIIGERLDARRIRKAKFGLVDRACRDHGVRSLADLGGCWGVDGAYLFHAVDNHPIERAVEVDTHPTPGFRERAARHKNVELVRSNFGSPDAVQAVGDVDAVILYDVLLHQVDPDWDEVLGAYGERVRCLIVFNQQWTGGSETIRLLDLGPDEYLRNVPLREFHERALERLEEIHPEHGRPWRDVHHIIWQWGITDADLERRAAELGFERAFYEDVGRFPGLENFRNRAFLFVR